MMSSVRKTLKTLVWSAQNRSISCEICLKITTKSAVFLPIAFRPSLPWKFPRNRPIFPRFCPQKSREIWLFFPRIIRSPVKLGRVCKFYWWVESEWLLLHKFWGNIGIFGVKYHNEKSQFQTFQLVVLVCIHYREGYTK